ncbi:phage holin family protein [Pigmentiphaga litoralis]|uniref:phage holin family protein n=1 Tax=Pigmentiphaga litoralis TaxID=516702 RepID=UPI003B428E47
MPGPLPLVGSLRSLAATSVGILKTRLELVAIELAEEKTRLMGLLILALAGLLCLAIGLLMFSFLVVVAFWDTDHRLLSIVLVGLVYLLLGIGMLFAVRKKAIDAPIAFEETLAELERDRELLAGDAPDDAYRSRP